jgi:hypothetical protein
VLSQFFTPSPELSSSMPELFAPKTEQKAAPTVLLALPTSPKTALPKQKALSAEF